MLIAAPERDRCAEIDKRIDQAITDDLQDRPLTGKVERALGATGYAALRAIKVWASGHVVILKGRVESYYLKQLAQATALAVEGTAQVRNELELIRPIQKRQKGR